MTLWVRATSHTRPRARDHYTSSTLISGNVGASPSSLHTTLEGLTEYVNSKMDVIVYVDSYMASNESFFMVTWIIFKNHLSEVGKHKTGRPWHSKHSQPLIDSILSCARTQHE
jgi:hypothetical protein